MREAPTQLMIRARGHAERALPPAPGTAQWEGVGPTNIGGRMTCAGCHADPAGADLGRAAAAECGRARTPGKPGKRSGIIRMY